MSTAAFNSGVSLQRGRTPSSALKSAFFKYIRRIESEDHYCGRLTRFADVSRAAGLPELRLTVWEFAGSAEPRDPAPRGLQIPAVEWVTFSAGGDDGSKLPIGRANLELLQNGTWAAGGVPEADAFRVAAHTNWPDVITIADDIAACAGATKGTRIEQALEFLYHCLEPGGVMLIDLHQQSAFSTEHIGTFAANQRTEDVVWRDDIVEVRKFANIYKASGIPLADRSSIFAAATCERAIADLSVALQLPEGARILDVGVGDGRFSKHLLARSRERGWSYRGLEMARKDQLRPASAELAAVTECDRNFFCLRDAGQYDAVVLFFVFHAYKHWPLYLLHARELLREGGVVIFSNRTDPFLRWTHGVFSRDEQTAPDNGASSVLTQTKRYWRERQLCGVRLFHQIATATDHSRCLSVCEQLGFQVDSVVTSESQRDYLLLRQQLCPDEAEPAMWNVGRVGLTPRDCSRLSKAFQVESIEETLPENMVMTVARKV